MRRYTNAQKVAYYRAKARAAEYGRSSFYSSRRRSYRAPIPIRTISGRGDYLTRFRRNFNKPYRYAGLGRRLGTAAGSYIGNAISPGVGGFVGGQIGGGLGELAHAGIKTITGYGDYTVKANSVVYNTDAVPQFSSDNPRCTIICHSEFIGDLRGSTGFNIASYDINPANSALFPWLSGIAQNFEQWVVQGMVFQFKTTCATAVASTNTALGTVILATQYNSLAPPFNSKVQMENYEFSQSTVPSASIMHAIECDPTQTAGQGLFYVNNDGYSDKADPRLYNIGKFNVATTGMQAAATIGELWVTYKICFLKPKLQGMNSVADHWNLDVIDLQSGVPYGFTPMLSETSSSYEVEGTDQALTALLTSPWTGVSDNISCFINPNYMGKLICTYCLTVPSGTVYQDPLLTVFGSLSLDSSLISSVQKPYSNISTMIQLTFVLNCTGGVKGVVYPYFTLASGILGVMTATKGTLTIMSVPPSISSV